MPTTRSQTGALKRKMNVTQSESKTKRKLSSREIIVIEGKESLLISKLMSFR